MTNEAASDLHILAAAYALNSLDAHESAQFERHLVACDACSDEVREMRETTAVLAASVAAEAPPNLRSRVLAQARETDQGPAESESLAPRDDTVVDLAERRSRRSLVNGWLAGVAAAAVLVAGGLGISTYQANQRANDTQVAAEQVAALLADPNATVERTAVSGGGTGTLVVAPDREQAAFLTSSLPAAGGDQTYQLWAIDAAGATSVGLLQPDSGRATQLVDLPPGTSTFGMTVEPAGGSEAPTTEPVLLVEISA